VNQDPPLEFANVAAQLLEPVRRNRRYAITNVDPLGVIERFTFADVATEVAKWAHLVREQGLEPDDRVVVLAGSAWEWRSALLGVLYAGGVAVPGPASASVEELRAIASHTEARLLLSIPARPDLVGQTAPPLLSAEELEAVDEDKALARPPHPALPGDVATILYARTATGLQGVVHTHASLIAQADTGEHWLGIREDERVWCTAAADGSAPSIWLLLAAWRERSNIVNVELELDPEVRLELLDKLHAAAVWFSDEEYAMLASAAAPPWIDLGSIRRALSSEESSAGATAFADAFGAGIAPLFGLDELGIVAGWPAETEHDAAPGTARPVPGIKLAIVDEHGAELPAGEVGAVVVRGDAQALFSGYAGGASTERESWLDLGWQGALGADESLRLVSRPPIAIELVEADVELPAAEPSTEGPFGAPEETPDEPSRRSKREAKRERHREEKQARERQRAEEQRRREEEKDGERAERDAAEAEERRVEKERRRAEAQERGERKQRREEKKARSREEQEAKERQKAEERRRREEEKERELAERAEAEERARAEEAERVAREAAEAEERRRAEEAARAEKRRGRTRRRQERQARRRAEQEDKEREKAEAAERVRREAAEADDRRRAEETARAEEGRRAEDEKQHGREQRREEKEARKRAEQEAKEAARAQRKTARAGKRGRVQESEPAANEKQSGERRRREAGEQSEPERLSGDIVSRINQYGMTAPEVEPDERQEEAAPPLSAEPNQREDAN
jgi:acyl-CoA synthetase (AMP-forming)/AMP-acid ligase II